MKTQCNPAVNCPVGGQTMPSVLKILFQQLRTDDNSSNTYFPRTIKDWNELPSMIIESNNLQSFTTSIINYYNFVHA